MKQIFLVTYQIRHLFKLCRPPHFISSDIMPPGLSRYYTTGSSEEPLSFLNLKGLYV